MYKLKYANLRRVVSTEKEKEERIKQGYILYGQDSEDYTEEDIQEEPEESIKEIVEPIKEETIIEDIEEEPIEEIEELKETKKGRGKNGE